MQFMLAQKKRDILLANVLKLALELTVSMIAFLSANFSTESKTETKNWTGLAKLHTRGQQTVLLSTLFIEDITLQ